MREIELTRGHVALVDDEDYLKVNSVRWSVFPSGNYLYAKHVSRKPNSYNERVILYMHRFILELTPEDNGTVDHINNNGLDNRKSNLRICSHSKNAMNAKKHIFKSSKYKGVSYRKDRDVWESSIKINGKKIALGHFFSETEAAEAYNKAAMKYFGEFSNLNIL